MWRALENKIVNSLFQIVSAAEFDSDTRSQRAFMRYSASSCPYATL